MNDAIRKAIQKADAKPTRCPWCGYSGMIDKHAPKKHPEKWEEWKANHEKVKVTATYWVEK